MTKSKILITDGLFPNKFASWRNVEILSFLNNYDVSVLVKHGKSWAGITFEIDFMDEIYKNVFTGSNYNFIIFDSEYNYLNKYNGDFDGTKFNGLLNHYSYCLTKETSFNVEEFDLIYHIFLGCYYDFNQYFEIPKIRQMVHLYPGGGFSLGQSTLLSNDVSVVATHPFSTKEIEAKGNPMVSCWTAPMYMQDEVPVQHRETESTLNVCFSSLGNGRAKGSGKYWMIANIYRVMFPLTKVRFHSIGNCPPSIFISNQKPLSFRELENFYADEIDVYLNLSSNLAFNGWPLGLEAMKNGAALLTTDPDNVSHLYQAEKYSIYPLNSLLDFILEIRKLEKSPTKLAKLKASHQIFVRKFAGFSNQQHRIFSFIDETLARIKS